jgi:hypothetical protein
MFPYLCYFAFIVMGVDLFEFYAGNVRKSLIATKSTSVTNKKTAGPLVCGGPAVFRTA